MMTTYSYETFPGQTIVRTSQSGYLFGELCEEIARNGEGMIVAADERSNDCIAALVGLQVADMDCVQRSDHGAGRLSVQIFNRHGQLIRDINWRQS